MKKQFIIAFISFLLISTIQSCAQIKNLGTINSLIEIGSVKVMGNLFVSLSFRGDDESYREYTIQYKNRKYEKIIDIQSISFYATKEEIEQLYTSLKEKINNINDERKSYQLGKEWIIVTSEK